MQLPTLKDFEDARERIAAIAIRTPLLEAQVDGWPQLRLKPESLQPVGSFKVRCAANALLRRDLGPDGATTASAGNFAQGLAYAGRALGVPVTTYVPETAARSKLEALERLGATVIPVPYARWWAMLAEPSDDPRFVHPVVDPDVLAGNGTIGLEILEDLPSVATVFAPYGGGGLSVGIAAALQAAGSSARVVACESEAGAPLRAALAAGAPVETAFDPKTFITGMGGPKVLAGMWPAVRDLLAGSHVVTLRQAADAVRRLVEYQHLVVEGAGAATLAAALAGAREGSAVCVLSGGHLDMAHLIAILGGETP